jgi:hypothetical protein
MKRTRTRRRSRCAAREDDRTRTRVLSLEISEVARVINVAVRGTRKVARETDAVVRVIGEADPETGGSARETENRENLRFVVIVDLESRPSDEIARYRVSALHRGVTDPFRGEETSAHLSDETVPHRATKTAEDLHREETEADQRSLLCLRNATVQHHEAKTNAHQRVRTSLSHAVATRRLAQRLKRRNQVCQSFSRNCSTWRIRMQREEDLVPSRGKYFLALFSLNRES